MWGRYFIMEKSLIYNSFLILWKKIIIYICIVSLVNGGGGVLYNIDNVIIWNYYFFCFLKVKIICEKNIIKNVFVLKYDNERKV